MKKIKYPLLFFLLLLTGCSNYKELTNIGITTAISIDYNNNEYQIITQVVNSVKKDDASSSNEPTFLNFYSSSSSLSEAINKIVLESPRKLYISQVQILLLSNEIIENHLSEVLEYFIRNPEIRGEMKVMLAPQKEDLKSVTVQTLLDNLSSSNIIYSLEEAEKEGFTVQITLQDLLDMYLNPYKEIILPTIEIEGNANEAKEEINKTSTVYKGTVKIGKLAIYKENKLQDYISFEEEKYLNIIRGTLKKATIKVDINEGYIVFELYDVKTKTKPNIKKNTVTISITSKAKSYEIVSNTDIEDSKQVKGIETFLEKYLEEKIIYTFNSIKEKYNTDAFNFRDLYYKASPKYLKEKNTLWYKELFPNLNINVKTKIKLYEKGKIKEEIKYVKENK